MYQWIVSLNGGERISSKDLLDENSSSNPWRRVLEYIRKNPANPNGEVKKITHIELVVNNVRYNSPSLSKNSSFRSSEDIDKFWIFYKSSADLAPRQNQNNELYLGYSFRDKEYRHIFWVNTKNNFCYVQVLNITNPKNRTEQEFAQVESEIEKSYDEVYK